MKFSRSAATTCMFVLGACFAHASVAAAGEKVASAYVVHGIPGIDLGLAPELPVDVSVNGECALPGFEFGDIVGPLALPAGTYNVAISLADYEFPCGNEPVLAASLDLMDGVNYSIVAYLDDTGAPTAGLFENDLSARSGRVSVNVAHTAWAPAVDVMLKRPRKGSRMVSVVPDVANGDSFAAMSKPGRWEVSLAPAGSTDIVFGPASLVLKRYAAAYLVFAVGSLENETFTLLVETVDRSRIDDDDDDQGDDGDDD